MFSKIKQNAPVKNILIIMLSNIGDVLLNAPAMDIILRDFPNANVSVVIGERAATVFAGNTRIKNIHIFDKNLTFWGKLRWAISLRQYHYDCVIDFRNTLIGYLLFPKWVTPLRLVIDKKVHLKDRHLNRLRTIYDFNPNPVVQSTIKPAPSDDVFIDALLDPFMGKTDDFIVIAPIAADPVKTWNAEGFMDVCNQICANYPYKIILVGAQKDNEILENIRRGVKGDVLNLSGKTNLLQLAALIKRASFAIVHDSGPMHIASYVNKPIVALFGPTDPQNSRPWGDHFVVVRRNAQCERCLNPSLEVPHTCMATITPDDVMVAFKELYGKTFSTSKP